MTASQLEARIQKIEAEKGMHGLGKLVIRTNPDDPMPDVSPPDVFMDVRWVKPDEGHVSVRPGQESFS